MTGPGDKDKKKKKKAYVLAEAPIKNGEREQAFITEAENVRSFYSRTDPDVEVEVIPFYGLQEFEDVKKKISGMSDNDEVFLFGHSGDFLGGVEHEKIAKALKDSGNKNCNIGSCSFEDRVDPYKDLQNVTYRGKNKWFGFNPNSDNLIDAMYSRANTDKDNVMSARVIEPEKGVHYNRIFNRPVIDAINAPERPLSGLASMIK